MDKDQQFIPSFDGPRKKSHENPDHQSTGQQKDASTPKTTNVGQDLSQPQSVVVEDERNPNSLVITPSTTSSKIPHLNSSFNTFNTTLNEGRLEDIRQNNHVKAFKILMDSQETMVEKFPESTPAPCGEPFGVSSMS